MHRMLEVHTYACVCMGIETLDYSTSFTGVSKQIGKGFSRVYGTYVHTSSCTVSCIDLLKR